MKLRTIQTRAPYDEIRVILRAEATVGAGLPVAGDHRLDPLLDL